MYITFKLFIILILYINNNIIISNGQDELTFVSISNLQQGAYPESTTDNTCYFSIIVSATYLESVGEVLVTAIPSTNLTINEKIKTPTTLIVQIDFTDVPYGSFLVNLNAHNNNNSISKTLQVNFTCEPIDFNSLEFKVIPIKMSNRPILSSRADGYMTITGLKYPLYYFTLNDSDVSIESLGFSAYEIKTDFTPSDIKHDVKFSILFENGNEFPIVLPSKYQFSTNDANNINYYPEQLKDYTPSSSAAVMDVISETFEPISSPATYMPVGTYSLPLYTFTITKASLNLVNCIMFPGYESLSFPTLISGDDDIYTYIGYLVNSFTPQTTHLFIQTLDKFVEFDNVTFVSQFYPGSMFQQGTVYVLPDEPIPLLRTIGLSNNIQYDFSNFYHNFRQNYLTSSWPYGFIGGNNKGYSYETSFILSDTYSSIGSDPYYINQDLFYDIISSPTTIGTNPELESVEFIHLIGFDFLLKLNISNFDKLNYLRIDGTSYSSESITIHDTILNTATIEIVKQNLYSMSEVQLYDIYGTVLYYNTGTFYQTPNSYIMFENPSILYSTDLYSITNISYYYNNINITDTIVSNILYFNIETHGEEFDVDAPIGMELLDQVSYKQNDQTFKQIQYLAVYNTSISKYQIEFKIPANTLTGVLPWRLINGDFQLSNSFLLDPNDQLIVHSNRFDAYSPIFKSISKTESSSTLGWKFEIHDPNGLDTAFIRIRGAFDSSLYEFNLTPQQNATGGDEFLGSYEISIYFPTIDDCVDQEYIITEVDLVDTQGNKGSFSTTDRFDEIFNPFINYVNNSGIIRNKFSSRTCTSNDPTSPTLKSFSIDSSTETGKVKFTFQAEDIESGMKENQYPIVYITTDRFEQVQCISEIDFYDFPYANYSCEVLLPWKFGNGKDLLVSVYGFINNGGYYGGFSTLELFNLGFGYSANDIITHLPSTRITGSSRLSNRGGGIWIYGSGFASGQFIRITYNKEEGIVENGFPSIVHSSAIFIPSIKPTNSKSILVEMFKNNGGEVTVSNEYTIDVIVFEYNYNGTVILDSSSDITTSSESLSLSSSSEVISDSCFGSPVCGGSDKGYCSSYGCICDSPWVGLDCSSKVIIIPRPSKNMTNPTIVIPVGGDSEQLIESALYKSIISIVSLREMTLNSISVAEYTFDKWIYNEINSTSNEYHTNITVIDLDGKPTITSIKVTIQWFKDLTSITFANQQLTMNPSTIKYTIEISNYSFKSDLNTLQLVMAVGFSSSKSNDICSLKEFGENHESNYIKVQIGDHSLYGRYIKRAIVDNTITTIDNVLLDSSSSLYPITQSASSVESLIGINLPHYKDSILFDPDFSVLLDSNDVSDTDENSICTNSKSKSLSNSQLAGIIIGSIAFAAVATIVVVYYIVKKKKDTKFLNSMHNKLNSMNK